MSLPQIKQQYVLLNGGLDLSSPPIAKQPSYTTTASNVEPVLNGGYRRTLGYDRYDGHPSPSENKGYYQLITDGLGVDTDYPLYSQVTWLGGSGVYLFRDGRKIFIASDSNPALEVGAVITIGFDSHTISVRSTRSASTREDSIKASGYASDYRRSLIGPVPGINDIRCVVSVRNSVFSFRDQDDINGGLFKSTSAGWVPVSDNINGFGSVLTIRDGYGIDDGDISMIRSSDLAPRNVVAQMSADGISGKLCLPVGQSCSIGDYLIVDSGNKYPLTLLSAVSGATTSFSVETTGNQMNGITIDPADNSGWYVVVSGKILPVISYLAKEGDATKCVLTISNPHSISIAPDLLVEVCNLYSFSEVTSVSKITIPAGGTYSVVVHNFYGSTEMRRAYIVNGIGRAIELREDGRVTPIFAVNDSGIDKPSLIEAHKEHLFLGFPGGQYQHSAIGSPLTWSGLLGAEAFSAGDEISSLKSIQGGVMIIACRNRLIILRGSSSGDWQQDIVSESVGIYDSTLQSIFIPIGLSDNGLVRLDRVQEYGDFTLSLLDITEKVSSIIKAYKWVNSSQLPSANQYRIYSSSGINLIATLDVNGTPKFSTFRYPSPVSGAWRYYEGYERNFIALSGMGYVYEINENASSFDGADIRWIIKTAYMHMNSPGTTKTWKNAIFDQGNPSVFNCDFWWSIEYRAGREFSSDRESTEIGEINPALWGIANWNQFYWNTQESSSIGAIQLNGNSTSIAFALSAKTKYEPNFNISGMLIDYIPRRIQHG